MWKDLLAPVLILVVSARLNRNLKKEHRATREAAKDSVFEAAVEAANGHDVEKELLKQRYANLQAEYNRLLKKYQESERRKP